MPIVTFKISDRQFQGYEVILDLDYLNVIFTIVKEQKVHGGKKDLELTTNICLYS